MRLLSPPWPALAFAALVFAAALTLLLGRLRNPVAGGDLPAPRCRTSFDCADRTSCLPDHRCGYGGRLRISVHVPPTGGAWPWLHLTLHDVERLFPERTSSWRFREGVAFPEVADLPDGRWTADFHASSRAAPDPPCAGDLRQTVSLVIAGGRLDVEGADRRHRRSLQLVTLVTRPACPAQP
ncbi:MAG: hypothetical protein JXB32_12860 [Deltaproteobacteria bacterium]|nr:hypothetical protein [Deltaproteobacteria bacterium]